MNGLFTDRNVETFHRSVKYRQGSITKKKSVVRFLGSTLIALLLAIGGITQGVAQSDLRIYKKINTQKPQLNEVVSVTLVVRNDGPATANGVVVQDSIPQGGATYVSQTVLRGGNTISFGLVNGTWSPGAIASGDSAVLEIKLKAIEQGVFFSSAEVIAMQGTDPDSQVNNRSKLEDDYTSVCFSIPIYWYAGDEFEVTVPKGYTNTQWARNGQPITSSTPTNVAVANGETLIIRSVGIYTFTTQASTCPAGGCCPIEVIQGPCGSIGNYVWRDNNNNGFQDTDEPGVANVRVRLYTQSQDSVLLETFTDSRGFYEFACLPTGNYRVRFETPNGSTFTTANAGTSGDDDRDSDAGTDGFSHVISINTSLPLNDPGRNNLTIDAGLRGLCSDNIPLVASGQSACESQPTSLIATSAGNTIRWYTTASGGTPFATVSSGSSVTVTASISQQTYYVEAVTPGGCVSPRQAVGLTVSAKPSVVANVSQADVCAGSSFTLTASVSNATSGVSYLWTGPNGFTSTSANPVLPTVTIAAGGTYQVKVTTANSCTALASVNVKVNTCTCDVNPPLLTCAVTQICPGETTTLHAANCNGTIVWSNGQTGSAITVSPAQSTTYSATCKTAICESKPSNAIAITIVEPQPPVIVAEADTVCPGGQIQLTATGCPGRVIWSTGATGNTLVATINAATTFYANCRVANCISGPSQPVTVYPGTPPVPRVICSATNLCPGESVVLTVVNCSGTPVWSTGATTTSITVAPVETTGYSVECRVGNCPSPRSETYTITVAKPTPPTVAASSSTTICNGSRITLTAVGCQGTVVWSTGARGTSLTVSPTTNVSYSAYCQSGTCNSEPSNAVGIVVTNPIAPLIKSTKTLLCAGEQVTLTAEGCTGTVIWSNQMSGSSITDRPGNTTNYTARCQVGTCISEASNVITINVQNSNLTAPTLAVSKSSICSGESVTLSATGCVGGTIVWSTGATASSITVTPTVTTEYYAACRTSSATCNGNPTKTTITVNTPPTPEVVCSADRICPGESLVLSVVNCTGTPLWSTGATTTSITVSPTTTTSYTVVCRNGDCSSAPSREYTIRVERPSAPTVTASTIEFTDGQEVTLTATGCAGGQLVWSTGATTSSIVVKPTTSISYYAQCRVGICLSDPAIINLRKKGECELTAPVVQASTPQVCYGGSVTLTATGCSAGTVVWSNSMTGNSITLNNLTASSTFTAVCRRDQRCSSPVSAPVSVTVVYINAPTVVANRPAICPGDTTTLTALGCPGKIVWSTGATTTSIVVRPDATTGYWAKCTVGTCQSGQSPINTVRVTTPSPTTVTASSTNICFGESVTLTATACQDGYVIWSNGLVGTTMVVSPATSSTFTAVCCTSGNCKSAVSNRITVNVANKLNKPLTVDKVNTCPFLTVDLTTAVVGQPATGNVFEFRTGESPTSPLVANPNAVQTGKYYVFEKSPTGCYSTPSVINVRITDCNTIISCTTNPASATAGPDGTLCDRKEYQLSGKIGGAAISSRWTTSGTGTFDNALLLNAIYRPSVEDIRAGFVTLTLTTNDPDGSGPCVPATSSLRLTINGISVKPTITALSNTVVCNGDSVTLKALPDGYRYRWNTNQTSQSIVVKAGGSYSVTLLGNDGCTSLTSDPISVTVNSPVRPPVVPIMARNTCPSTTVNLMSLVENTPQAGGRFEYRSGVLPTSPVVLRPDSVGQGKYFVFERNVLGCYSAGAPVEVRVFNCAIDTCRSDVYITKTVDKLNPRVGDVVTFTIKLGNKGACTATHVDIRDKMPEGLELISNGNLAVDQWGFLAMWVTPLQVGEVREYFYKARVLKRGPITNKAEIVYLDQVDPVLTNNTASVTIQDTTTAKPQFVGLAKEALGVTKRTDGSYAFRFRFNVTNYSGVDARKVQVADNLGAVFSPNTVVSTTLSAGNTNLKFNSQYTGTGSQTQMLDTASVVKAGDTESFLLTAVVRLSDAADTLKTFYNEATLTALLNGIAVQDVSTSGDTPDPDRDGNPTNNSTPTAIRISKPTTPSQLGVALAVISSVKQPDESYNVTYKITLKNFGVTNLTKVQLNDSLSRALSSPADFTVVGVPVVRTGSSLVPNPSYNGKSVPQIILPASTLNAGVTDSVLVTVRIRPNGLTGTIMTQVVGTATRGDTLVTDLSTNGFTPDPGKNQKTPIRLDLPASLLGVAKDAGTPVSLGNGIYDVPYTIYLTNMGASDLQRVQVVDNLTQTFESKGVLIVSNKIKITAQQGLAIDTNYTGRGLLTKLLVDSLSTLPKGTTRTLSFTVRVDVRNAQGVVFNNLAIAQALNSAGVISTDTSTAGANVDPDSDLEPRNNSIPTSVTLTKGNSPAIGVALSVKKVVQQNTGTHMVTYQAVLKNFSSLELQNVQLNDSLASYVFNTTTGASYTAVGTPEMPLGSRLIPNPNFNGDSDTRLLLSGSKLAVGAVDTVWFSVLVRTDGRTTPYLNSVYAQGVSGLQMVRDISTDGVNPDPNGNNDPTEDSERVATPVIIESTITGDIKIPQGFSPNGDGINDRFVIDYPGNVTLSLEVFNRWGHAVYRNDNYQNDWDGTANTGLNVGSVNGGLPDGTYYYIVRLSDGRRFIRYMTINR